MRSGVRVLISSVGSNLLWRKTAKQLTRLSKRYCHSSESYWAITLSVTCRRWFLRLLKGGEGSISDRSVTKPDATMKAGSSVVFLLHRGLSPHKLLGFFGKYFVTNTT